jgi:hypothetical protein
MNTSFSNPHAWRYTAWSLVVVHLYLVVATWTLVLARIAAPNIPSWQHSLLACLAGLVFMFAGFRVLDALLN